MIIENPIVIDIKDSVELIINYDNRSYHVDIEKLLNKLFMSGCAYITVNKEL